jgi:cbb3-type cytochrome oxidase maturation protein
VDSLYLLIPVALVFCFIAIKLLLWAIDSGQYDDLDKEASRILMDEPEEIERKSVDTHPDSARDRDELG